MMYHTNVVSTYFCFDRIHTDGEVCTGDAQFTGNTIHSVLHGVHIFKQDGQPGYVSLRSH